VNIAAKPVLAQPAGVCVVRDQKHLSAFCAPSCAAALLQRDVPIEVLEWLEGVDPDRLPRGRVILPAATVGNTVANLCETSGLPAGRERDWLHTDIVNLAGLFAGLMGTQHIRLRLDVITTNACRKFHMDAIRARLICTYRGTGTQYGTSRDGHDPEHIFTTAPGDAFLMRGSEWLDHPQSGLKHRSPPIEGTGETRLVLVLDPIFEPAEGV